MARLHAILAAGCLVLAAPSAFAIPLGVGIIGGGGTWTLSGPTPLQDDWALLYYNTFEVLPGSYSWTIQGLGLGGAAWAVTLNNQVIYHGSATGLLFNIKDNHTYEVGSAVAVPEPGPLALLGIGLAALGLAMRRRFLRRYFSQERSSSTG